MFIFFLKNNNNKDCIVIQSPSGLPKASLSHKLCVGFKAPAAFAVIKGQQMILKPLMQKPWYKDLESPCSTLGNWSTFFVWKWTNFFFCAQQTFFNFIRFYYVHRVCENNLIIILRIVLLKLLVAHTAGGTLVVRVSSFASEGGTRTTKEEGWRKICTDSEKCDWERTEKLDYGACSTQLLEMLSVILEMLISYAYSLNRLH